MRALSCHFFFFFYFFYYFHYFYTFITFILGQIIIRLLVAANQLRIAGWHAPRPSFRVKLLSWNAYFLNTDCLYPFAITQGLQWSALEPREDNFIKQNQP